MFSTKIILLTLAAFLALTLLYLLVKAWHKRVWINHNSPIGEYTVAYLDFKQKKAATEFFLYGGSRQKPIGLLGDTEATQPTTRTPGQHYPIQILTSTDDDDSMPLQYDAVGYLTPEGIIYEYDNPHSAHPIAYLAQPKKPHEPTLKAERRGLFKSKRVLAAYPYEHLNDISLTPKALTTVRYRTIRKYDQHDLTPEAKGAAFGTLLFLHTPQQQEEYYRQRAYTWKDTALLTSIVYSILYILLSLADYLTARYAHTHLISDMPIDHELLLVFYFVLWAIIRQWKISTIENSKSVQPVLNMLNKSLSLKWIDYSIIFLAGLFILLTRFYNPFFFSYTPMAAAILIGVFVNRLYRQNQQQWEIAKTTEQEEHEATTADNPIGDIIRVFDWDLDSTRPDQQLHGNLSLYFTLKDIQELRRQNPFYQQQTIDQNYKDTIAAMHKYIFEHKNMLLRMKYIVTYINRETQGLHVLDKMQFALDFVQEPNITYTLNQNSQAILKNENYIRFPDEVLYDKEGDCQSKALLAAVLFNLMGHQVLYLYSRTQQHAAIGVEVTDEWLNTYLSRSTAEQVIFTLNGKRYIFCETTGDKFRLGGLANGISPNDFEDHVLL